MTTNVRTDVAQHKYAPLKSDSLDTLSNDIAIQGFFCFDFGYILNINLAHKSGNSLMLMVSQSNTNQIFNSA